MKQVTLNGTLRATGSKAAVKSVRKADSVPCVIYGNGMENITFSVDAKEFNTIISSPSSFIIKLNIEGKEYLSILHDVQYHPVKDNAIHADFLAVSEDKPVSILVPVEIFGNSEGVKLGGKLMGGARKLRVKGLIANLPDTLPVDITNLGIGKRINAGDLSYEGIEIVSPRTTIVCSVKMTRGAAQAAAGK